MLNLAAIVDRYPDKVALIVAEKAYTYAELDDLTNRLAGALRQRGISLGERVAFLLPNCLEIILCYFACLRIGAVAVPLNLRFGPELLCHVINHSGARLLVCDPDRFAVLEKLRPELPEVKDFYVTGRHSDLAGVGPFDDLLAAPTFSRTRGPAPTDASPAAIYYTSGTTGLPKAVIHTHGSLQQAARNQTAAVGLASSDVTLVMFPVCYLIGFGSQVVPFLSCGATCVLLPYFEPGLALKAMETHQPTQTYGFPKLYQDLVDAPEARRIRSLKFCFSAGEAMPPAVHERFKRVFGVDVTEGCGMTELQIYSMNPPFGQKKVGSIGKPIGGMEVSLVDGSGQRIARAREIGEITVRGLSMTNGYWKDAELTTRAIRQGWFPTGDLAYRDEDDFYWFIGRRSEVIRHQTGLISPLEVEGVLYQHPSVKEAGVIGVPDGRNGEWVQAHVVLRDASQPVTPQELIDFTKTRLAGYKVPARVILADCLPLGLTGKIDRMALRKGALR